jgi:phosphatidylglycerophosphate synthase
MHSTIPKFTLADVEKVLPLKSWWAIIAVLPLVRRLTVLVVNQTGITPNAITIASILLRLAAAGAFLLAGRQWLIAGALAFYFAYLLDCMDGAVSRLRKQSSEFGRFLDHIGDLVGGLLAVIALSFGQNMLFTVLVAAILFCHVAESYISYLTSTILSGRKGFSGPQAINSGIIRIYLQYRAFFHSRNIKSFFSFPDYEAMTFLAFPLLGMPALGLQVGFCIVTVVTLYTVFSSFMAIHTGGNKFP